MYSTNSPRSSFCRLCSCGLEKKEEGKSACYYNNHHNEIFDSCLSFFSSFFHLANSKDKKNKRGMDKNGEMYKKNDLCINDLCINAGRIMG